MEFLKETNVVVIGGGITGTAILRELSKYELKCLLVEKEPDLAVGTTKANSAICHAGFDAPTGSWKQKTNIQVQLVLQLVVQCIAPDIGLLIPASCRRVKPRMADSAVGFGRAHS